jgi:hypothetical protein
MREGRDGTGARASKGLTADGREPTGAGRGVVWVEGVERPRTVLTRVDGVCVVGS